MSRELRAGDVHQAVDAVTELEKMGYSTIWLSGMNHGSIFSRISDFLDVSDTLTVATGVLAVSFFDVGTLVHHYREIDAKHPNRFLVGLGGAYGPSPLAELGHYLDGLDRAETHIPRERRVLGVLGPRMLKLAADRTLGAFPALLTPEHTARARQILGDGFLAAHQVVVLGDDPAYTRATARRSIGHMLRLPPYRAHWRRVGFTDKDFENGGSDTLIDALVAMGTIEDVAARVRAHYAAGADQVVVQVFGAGAFPLREWRRLADAIKNG